MRADSGTVPTREKTLSGEKERVDEATRATRADDSNLIEKSLTAAEMVRSTPARFARRPRRSIAGGKSRRTLFVCLARVLRKAIRFASRGVAPPDGESRGVRARAARPSHDIVSFARVQPGGSASRARRRDVTVRGPARQGADRAVRYFPRGDTLPSESVHLIPSRDSVPWLRRHRPTVTRPAEPGSDQTSFDPSTFPTAARLTVERSTSSPLPIVQETKTGSEGEQGSGGSGAENPEDPSRRDSQPATRAKPSARAGPSNDGDGESDDVSASEPSEKKRSREKLLRLDYEALARLSSAQEWSEEVAGCLESYRADLRRGKNPFEGAFPLWRNEQFRAATLSEDPVKLETYAKIERAIMTAAEREETRRRNAADAATGDEATFTGVGGAALAAGLGEDDGEEVDIEGTVAIEEGLKETEEGAEEMSPEPARRFDSDEERKPPVASPVAAGAAPASARGAFASRDRVLVAAAGAAAAHKGEHKLRSLMLGRRWYEGSQYPTPGNLAAEAASAGAPTHSGSSGGSGGPNSGSGSGSGDATTVAATHFVRPPKLILRPDGTTLEAHDRAEEELARVSSRDSETTGFHPSHRAAINPTHVYAQHATNPPQMYHPPQMTRGQPSPFDGASAAAEQYRRAAAAAAGQVSPCTLGRLPPRGRRTRVARRTVPGRSRSFRR